MLNHLWFLDTLIKLNVSTNNVCYELGCISTISRHAAELFDSPVTARGQIFINIR